MQEDAGALRNPENVETLLFIAREFPFDHFDQSYIGNRGEDPWRTVTMERWLAARSFLEFYLQTQPRIDQSEISEYLSDRGHPIATANDFLCSWYATGQIPSAERLVNGMESPIGRFGRQLFIMNHLRAVLQEEEVGDIFHKLGNTHSETVSVIYFGKVITNLISISTFSPTIPISEVDRITDALGAFFEISEHTQAYTQISEILIKSARQRIIQCINNGYITFQYQNGQKVNLPIHLFHREMLYLIATTMLGISPEEITHNFCVNHGGFANSDT